MPELPEVETIRRQLQDTIIGMQVTNVEVRASKSFDGDIDQVVYKRIQNIRRFGKGLVVDLITKKSSQKSRDESNDSLSAISLVIHLKMTGQVILESHELRDNSEENMSEQRIAGGHPTKDFVNPLPSSHTRVIFCLQDPDDPEKQYTLYFNDQRKFGWIKAVATAEVENISFIKKLGLEPKEIAEEDWYQIMQRSRKAVKVRLMDQDQIAGVGNIYANDACWMAEIDPRTPANKVTRKRAEVLHQCVINVLQEGVDKGGATAADGKYIDLQGLGGSYQDFFKVYQREGEACLREDCDGEIVKEKVGGRGTFFCPVCQK